MNPTPLLKTLRDDLHARIDASPSLTARLRAALATLRDEHAFLHDEGLIGTIEDRTITLWTFAGDLANRRLAHWIHAMGWERPTANGLFLRASTTASDVEAAAQETLAHLRQSVPDDPEMNTDDWLFRGIKFARLLPPALAADTLRARIWDDDGARRLLLEPVSWIRFEAA